MSTSVRRRGVLHATSALCAAVLVFAVAAPGAAAADPGVDSTMFVPAPTPVTDHCPNREHTPPAVDESESVPPGSTTPAPLAVPTPAVGGDRLAGCGVVHEPAAGPLPAHLTSAAWLIADLDTGRVIAAKDPHGRYRPASTIKVLLAVTALRELDLDKVVVGTPTDYTMEGDSCGMGPNGRYTVRELLTGLLMVSGNDCANALARELGGYDTTLAKMNAEAKSLGATDTRAASPSGLDAAGMSTSPYDEALIFRAAMRNSEFRRMIGLAAHPFPGFPKLADVPDDVDHPGYMMGTSNPLLRDGYPGMLGGKTGYTDDALKTFVGAVERDGRRILIVQMAGLNVAGDSYAQQAQRMIDYGFAAPASTSVGTLAVGDGTGHSPYSAAPHDGDSHNDSGSGPTVLIAVGAVTVLALVGAAVLAVRRRRQGADD